MNKIPKVMFILAALSMSFAILIKVTDGRIMPGAIFINWARIADTFLLFSIALSLLNKK